MASRTPRHAADVDIASRGTRVSAPANDDDTAAQEKHDPLIARTKTTRTRRFKVNTTLGRQRVYARRRPEVNCVSDSAGVDVACYKLPWTCHDVVSI